MKNTGFYFQVDSVRIELSCRTSSWYLRELFAGVKKKSYIGIGVRTALGKCKSKSRDTISLGWLLSKNKKQKRKEKKTQKIISVEDADKLEPCALLPIMQLPLKATWWVPKATKKRMIICGYLHKRPESRD